jgi:hypothetical protein
VLLTGTKFVKLVLSLPPVLSPVEVKYSWQKIWKAMLEIALFILCGAGSVHDYFVLKKSDACQGATSLLVIFFGNLYRSKSGICSAEVIGGGISSTITFLFARSSSGATLSAVKNTSGLP